MQIRELLKLLSSYLRLLKWRAILNLKKFQKFKYFYYMQVLYKLFSKHLEVEGRNVVNQVYIRRFFCDYKNTSNTS
jgi:hypothetical protein